MLYLVKLLSVFKVGTVITKGMTASLISRVIRKPINTMRSTPWVIPMLSTIPFAFDMSALIISLGIIVLCILLVIPYELLIGISPVVASAAVSYFMSAANILHFPVIEEPVTWLSYFQSIIQVLNPALYPSYLYSTFKGLYDAFWWYNYAIWITLTSIFGYVGLAVVLKGLSLVSVIAASVANMCNPETANLAVWMSCVLVSTGYHLFLEPMFNIIDSFDLVTVLRNVLPDPRTVVEVFIQLNTLPWRIMRMTLAAIATGTYASVFRLSNFWNLVLEDFSIFPDFLEIDWNIDLYAMNPGNINRILAETLFYPTQNTINRIIRSLLDMRSIWR